MILRKRQTGFTLIEAVVSTAVFAFVVSSMVGVYIATLNLDRKSRAQRAVVDNGRYVTEFIAKEVRNGHIDYSGSNGCAAVYSAPSTDLCVVNQAGELEKFSYDSGSGSLMLRKNGSSTSLNSRSTKFVNFTFNLLSRSDPYTAAKTSNIQPGVRMVMQLTSGRSGTTEFDSLNLESTAVERYYPTR